MSGKAYANRRKAGDRPVGDFYQTPKSLVWRLTDTGELSGYDRIIDPCAGHGSIIDALSEDKRTSHMDITGFDYYTGVPITGDIYEYEQAEDVVVTNFPFSEWDAMVQHSLSFARKVCTIGRVNYFGTHARNKNKLWKHLHNVYIFDRMVDYRGNIDAAGQFYVGALVTGWFVFEQDYKGPTFLNVIDVQEFASLGAVKE